MLIPLRDQGVTDLRGYLLANRDFVRATMQVAMVLDLNRNGLLLFGASERDDIVGQGSFGILATKQRASLYRCAGRNDDAAAAHRD